MTTARRRPQQNTSRQYGAIELFVCSLAFGALTALCLAVGLPFVVAVLAGIVGCLGGVAASSYGSWKLVLITALAGALTWLAFVATRG